MVTPRTHEPPTSKELKTELNLNLVGPLYYHVLLISNMAKKMDSTLKASPTSTSWTSNQLKLIFAKTLDLLFYFRTSSLSCSSTSPRLSVIVVPVFKAVPNVNLIFQLSTPTWNSTWSSSVSPDKYICVKSKC